jgi:hypothetical protein
VPNNLVVNGGATVTIAEHIEGKLASALSVVGTNKWVRQNKPSFRTGGLYFPKSSEKKAGIRALHIVNCMQRGMLRTKAKEYSRRKDCTTFPTAQEYPGPGDYLLRFQGMKGRVDKLMRI